MGAGVRSSEGILRGINPVIESPLTLAKIRKESNFGWTEADLQRK